MNRCSFRRSLFNVAPESEYVNSAPSINPSIGKMTLRTDEGDETITCNGLTVATSIYYHDGCGSTDGVILRTPHQPDSANKATVIGRYALTSPSIAYLLPLARLCVLQSI